MLALTFREARMRRWAAAAALLALAACQPDKAQEELARQESVVLTSGQALDCTDALGEAGRVVCADANLRILDRQLAELWSEVSAVTGRPTTLSRRHADWLADRDAGQRDWNSGERRTRTAEELTELYEGYIAALTEERRLAEAIPDSSPVSALAGGCIGAALDGCQAPAAGYVTGPSGQRLAWQIQEGSTDFAGVSAGLLLFAVEGDTLVPIGWSYEAAMFEAPAMFQTDAGVFVAARGFQAGTGNQNADVLFRFDAGRWIEIEIESWKTALADQLPEGFGVWKGVDYRWPEMFALSQVWRDGDANCCPTGGEATMDLAIEGTSLRLASLDFEPRAAPES